MVPALLLMSAVFQSPDQKSGADRDWLAGLRVDAEKGDAVAQFTLGVVYGDGVGVAKDEAEAVKWWRKAAEQNHSLAQCWLGVCHARGQGVVKDAKRAVNERTRNRHRCSTK